MKSSHRGPDGINVAQRGSFALLSTALLRLADVGMARYFASVWSRHALCFLIVFVCGIAGAAERPNIVLILADDLGWADLGCYGNRFNETPNIDRLAKQGVRFTDYHSAGAVCSPTRASLMTGQYPARVGITAHIPGHWRPFEKLTEPPNRLDLPKETVTIAERLQEAGYATAYFGKWHLNWQQSGPEEHGFQTAFSHTGHTVAKERQGSGQKSRRACDYLAEQGVQFIQSHRAQPFFVVISPSAVHIPLNTTPELQKKYEAKPKVAGYSCHPLYAGLLEELDDVVGRVMNSLDTLGLTENTLLIFTSDNGGLEKEMGGMPGTLNHPLRNEKGSLYEGGIRVPLAVRWPKVIAPGGVANEVSSSIDLYPTFLDAANIDVSHGSRSTNFQEIDGTSLMGVLKKPETRLKRDALYWHYPHYHHSRPSGAIRQGGWKLIEFFDTGELELYDLNSDLGEAKDVASQMPDKTRELHSKLQAWRKDVDAQMPQLNPAYDPKRAQEWWNRAKVESTEAPGTLRP